MQPLKPIKITRSKEKMTNRISLPLIEQIVERLGLREKTDKLFPKPGSNRGIKPSDYVMTLVHMIIDGAMHLEDVNQLHSDEGYQELLKEMELPTSDAIGDWLRRHGGKESEKGDSKKTYKGSYGYHPLLGIIAENGMIAGSDFREGNNSPQSGLIELIDNCRDNYPQPIKLVRSDSAGWQKAIVDYCNSESIGFTITADQSESVLEAIKSIPEDGWQKGIDREGVKEEYKAAETTYCFGTKKREVRLVVKRTRLKAQYDLFASYSMIYSRAIVIG